MLRKNEYHHDLCSLIQHVFIIYVVNYTSRQNRKCIFIDISSLGPLFLKHIPSRTVLRKSMIYINIHIGSFRGKSSNVEADYDEIKNFLLMSNTKNTKNM